MKNPKPHFITAILTEEDSWIIAEDAATHVTTQGKTMDEAIRNLREAVQLYLEESDEDRPVTPPKITLATIEL